MLLLLGYIRRQLGHCPTSLLDPNNKSRYSSPSWCGHYHILTVQAVINHNLLPALVNVLAKVSMLVYVLFKAFSCSLVSYYGSA